MYYLILSPEEIETVLTQKEKHLIIECAKKYKVATVLLFGSSLKKGAAARDIDIGIKGIKPEFFFTFYAELFQNLSKPIDLIDLDEEHNYFIKRIFETGQIIYEL